jgi:HD-GYP domain-containing protein (c-di-GMP phosphodiesterase class II)
MLEHDEQGAQIHAWSTSIVAYLIAKEAMPRYATEVFYAGLLHDLGAVGALTQILRQPMPATQQADPHLINHPINGAQLVRGMPTPLNSHLIADMVLDHHEWWDGRGYPNAKQAGEISLGGRILRIADAYSIRVLMLSTKGLTLDEEYFDQTGPGREFSPELFELFLHRMSSEQETFQQLTDPLRLEGLFLRIRDELPQVTLFLEPLLWERLLALFAETVDQKNPFLAGHCRRVADYAGQLGEALGLGPEEIAELRSCAMLHDVGKVGMPISILEKPGPLDDDEWDVIKQHTLRGEQVLSIVPLFQKLIPIVRHEHERYDGLGYPDGLQGEDIPLFSRIIAVADAFDAMTSARPYHKVRTAQATLEVIAQGVGRQFDPGVVAAAQQVFR